MKKITLERISSALPSSLKNIASYIKDNFDKSGQDTLSSSTGTIGVLIKLFAQEKIDNYFEQITKNKLDDFGSNTYLQASLKQVSSTLEYISKNDETFNGIELDSKDIEELLLETLSINDSSFDTRKILTIFTPRYHPSVNFIKCKILKILDDLGLPEQSRNSFSSHFNKHIELTLIDSFGADNYDKHKLEIEDYLLKENEANILWDTHELHRIGFKENENLVYEDTYASWRPVNSLNNLTTAHHNINYMGEQVYDEIIAQEKELVFAETLIEDYFNHNTPSNQLHKIAFAIADFGKGKTVFLKQFASKLAKKYIETGEGFFPIYFNLRNFSKYPSSGKTGVIGEFLLTEYGIRIEDEYFKKNKYIFLMDSLDESGELTKHTVDNVVQSIKNIQNIDKEKNRDNRIIITSRPFPDGLEHHLVSHIPWETKDEDNNSIANFICLHGFTSKQFNHWLYNSLSTSEDINSIKTTGFAKEIVNDVISGKTIDIHKKLFNDKTLSIEELRRPIFSYMIFQLILNNIDFSEIGKIGIYLSFINLLTKEAKHINDKSYNVNIEDEIKYRNILHSIAALWTYERQNGKQGILKKADICRVLEAKQTNESDKDILERYSEDGVVEIQFLSHSYFGENNNSLHFQHQSFAEILLAEYYLKILIKYSLDKKGNIEEARYKLSIGEPTEQTILFLKELLKLLKETVTDTPTKSIIEKRKLLYPLLAALAQEENNTLYSDDLYYDWFRNSKSSKPSTTYPKELLNTWAITSEKLERMLVFLGKILDSETTIIFSKSERKSSLFNQELTVFQNNQRHTVNNDIDKWITLIAGNLLQCNSTDCFNSRLKKPTNLFSMIRDWNHSNQQPAPKWAKEYFNGINCNDSTAFDLSYLNLSTLDFSNSNLKNIRFDSTDLSEVNFTNCNFSSIDIINANITGTNFTGVNILKPEIKTVFGGGLMIGHSRISYNIAIPDQLANHLIQMYGANTMYVNSSNRPTFIGSTDAQESSSNLYHHWFSVEEIFKPLKGLFQIGLRAELFDKNEIKSWFSYEDEKTKIEAESLINSL